MSKIIVMITVVLFIIFPEQIKNGAKEGIENGIFILLPSVFPYMVISNIFIKSGAADTISGIIYKIIKPVFRFKKRFSSAYLISLFCGYPTGARMAVFYEKNSNKEALRLFLFGNVPGFGFCVSFLGALTENIRTGVKIYLCFVCASLILNYIFSFCLKDKEKYEFNERNSDNIAVSVTEAVKEGILSIFNVIGYTVFFSSVSELFKNRYISAFLEITSGLRRLDNIYEIVFFAGFSGLSVIFQSLSFKKAKTPLLLILFARVIFALTAVLLFYVLKKNGL